MENNKYYKLFKSLDLPLFKEHFKKYPPSDPRAISLSKDKIRYFKLFKLLNILKSLTL